MGILYFATQAKAVCACTAAVYGVEESESSPTREIMMLEIVRDADVSASSNVEKRSPQGRVHGTAHTIFGASPGQFVIKTGAQSPQTLEIPAEYLTIFQELQAAQHQQQQQQQHLQEQPRPAAGGKQQQQLQPVPQYLIAARPGQGAQHYGAQNQIQLLAGETAQQYTPKRVAAVSAYGPLQTQLQNAYQDQRVATQNPVLHAGIPGHPAHLLQAQASPLIQAQQYAQVQASLAGLKDQGAPQGHQVQYQQISALADSSFEKELAQLVAANQAQELASKPKQRVASQPKPAYRPQAVSPQPQYTFIQQQEHPQFTQYRQEGPQVSAGHLAQLRAEAAQGQGVHLRQGSSAGSQSIQAPQYVSLKQAARKPVPLANHQYLAETTQYAGQPAARPQHQPKYESQGSQYERQSAAQYDRSQAVKIVPSPQLQQYDGPLKAQQQTPQQQRYQPKAQSSEDQEFIQSLLNNPREGLFSGVKPKSASPSRSSIYVSQSTGGKRPNGVTIEEVDVNEQPEQEGPVPVVRLPSPKGRPLTQEEFQSLVDAGYSVTAIPVPVPVPADEKPAYQSKFQRSYATPPPDTAQQQQQSQEQQQEEVEYRPEVRYQTVAGEHSTPASVKRVKQRRPLRPQYRLTEEASNQQGVTYLLPLDGQATTNYGTRTNVRGKDQ